MVPRSVADVLNNHVTLEVECIDRMYLNVYVPKLRFVGSNRWTTVSPRVTTHGSGNASATDSALLSDRLLRKWLKILPHPYTPADRREQSGQVIRDTIFLRSEAPPKLLQR